MMVVFGAAGAVVGGVLFGGDGALIGGAVGAGLIIFAAGAFL